MARLIMSSYLTYRKLRDFLNNVATEEQLDQPVQVVPPCPDGDKPAELHGVYEINTVEYFFSDDTQKTRSVIDNQHHPEQIVLLSDWNPFSPEGDTYYTMKDDGTMVGNVSGKKIKFGNPDIT